MLVLKNGQMTVWDELLPKEVKVLSEELQKIDEILDDQSFFEPFIKRFNTKTGRPTIKVETYMREPFFVFWTLFRERSLEFHRVLRICS